MDWLNIGIEPILPSNHVGRYQRIVRLIWEMWAYNAKTGLKPNPKDCDLTGQPYLVTDSGESFSEDLFYRRLGDFGDTKRGNRRIDRRVLGARLAWTVTYFAYACEQYLRVVKGDEKFLLDHLAIVCVPASFSKLTSAALYLPLRLRMNSMEFPRAAIKGLYLARALGMPLQELKDFSRGESQSRGIIAHQLSAVSDSIFADVKFLLDTHPNSIGGSLLARLHLLRTTINAFGSRESHRQIGPFPYPWSALDRPLKVYGDIAIQLGFARAQDASQAEQKVRDCGAVINEPAYRPGQSRFDSLRDKWLEPMPDLPPDLDPVLKRGAFAVLLLLILKQAVYHTIRARAKGMEGRVQLVRGESQEDVLFSCIVRNPQVESSDADCRGRVKDVPEFATLAAYLSSGESYEYEVAGPCHDPSTRSWTTILSVRSRGQPA